MAKNKLRRMGRFELLEIIYQLRRENLALRERCEQAEKRAAESAGNGGAGEEAAGDLHQRMTKLEAELQAFRQQNDAADGAAPAEEPTTQEDGE